MNPEKERLTKQWERANRELNDFTYIVSHDLKAPLRGIGSLVSWILSDNDDKLNGDVRESLNLITGRVQRMNDLIDGLLKMAKAGRGAGDPQSIDMNRLLKEVVGKINPPAAVEIEIEKNVSMVKGDPTHLQQIFQNLIENAVNFMDKPKGKIRISQKENGAHWEFSVVDNGPGIDKKHHERIFQLFQTLTPRDTATSAGVGLCLVKKIVELSDGKVWVESEPGQGSAFYVTLPKIETRSLAHAA